LVRTVGVTVVGGVGVGGGAASGRRSQGGSPLSGGCATAGRMAAQTPPVEQSSLVLRESIGDILLDRLVGTSVSMVDR
jgi:hypothetical protein